MNFADTIEILRSNNLIEANDAVIVAKEEVSTSSAMLGGFCCGAIGGAVAAAMTKKAIMTVNPEMIKIFEIDQDTGEYLNIVSKFPREQLKKVTLSRFYKRIRIYAVPSGKYFYYTNKSWKGYQQNDDMLKAFDLIEQYYSKLT